VALIIPFPAGGAMDLLGRGVAQDLADKLGQQFVVDNRAGAAGNIGAMAAAKASPDGYTILMAGAASLALNKFMFSNMPYDPETELTPIVILSRLPHIFVVNARVEAKTLKELVDYAKANPGKLSAGVPGVGTTAHITLEAFMAETGAKMTVVPYRSEPQMLTDLVGGQLDFACTLTTSPGPHIQAGRLRALARHLHAAIAGRPHGGASGLPRLRSHRLVCAGRTHRDAGRNHCQDQCRRERLYSQCQGRGGIEQARLAAGRWNARGDSRVAAPRGTF
jgi:tripartite-type tricarboxylate transporter receptor subunit TctC